jgi:site-specific recombinase XerD
MKKKETFVEIACREVAGFSDVYSKLEQKIILSSQSKSTFTNYGRKLAHLCLHFNALPHEVSDDQIDEYLAKLARSSKTPSRSAFKHTVYGLRYYFRLMDLPERAISLPIIPNENKLPEVLSKQECKRLFKAPDILKHRVILSMIYSAGLRSGELCRLKISDVDSGRMMIHIRRAKGCKDRYVPLSKNILLGLRKYFKLYKPKVYLFNGKEKGAPFSPNGLRWIMRESVKKAGILKTVCVHTLRHSYATHLLEDGLDIVTIKELMGHDCIESTMIYLHIARPEKRKAFSPFDTLYGEAKV